MMIIKTSLKEIKGKGIGLICQEKVKKGQSIWRYNPIVDVIINKKDIPKEAGKFYETYSVDYGNGRVMLNTDNARFMNHSKNPNTKSLGKKKDNIALRNINQGEELTINYKEIDMNGKLNFKSIE